MKVPTRTLAIEKDRFMKYMKVSSILLKSDDVHILVITIQGASYSKHQF